ncbi:YuiA family protein [Thermoactinomyces mirandus]|uniref:YuiA family protein n=1 Tax=Thermoactinomyces mirandus TaxID=2756294 RepID=UPI0035E444AE
MTVVSDKKCEYCDGQGYVNLLLGGSESCYACHGTGTVKARNSKAQKQTQNSKY